MSSKKQSSSKAKTKRVGASAVGDTVSDAATAGPTSVKNVNVGNYLAEPDGVRLKPEHQSPKVRAL